MRILFPALGKTRRAERSEGCVGIVPRTLSNSNFRIQIYILDGLDHFHPFLEGPLEGLAAQDQAHATCALVNDGREDRVCQVGSALTFATAVDQSYAAAIAV